MLNSKDRMLLDNFIATVKLASADSKKIRKPKRIQSQKPATNHYTEEQKQYCRDYYQKNKKKKQTQALMYYEVNRDDILEQKRTEYANNENMREKQKAYGREYRKDKREHYHQLTADWREKNREKYNAYMREYRKRQKEVLCQR